MCRIHLAFFSHLTITISNFFVLRFAGLNCKLVMIQNFKPGYTFPVAQNINFPFRNGGRSPIRMPLSQDGEITFIVKTMNVSEEITVD